MTFNGISWGYVDEEQARAYAYTAPRILKMLHTCTRGGGNLLLNIGPKPDGSVPADAVEPLKEVGRWLARNGEAAYGKRPKNGQSPWPRYPGGNGVSAATCSADFKTVYVWMWIWPHGGETAFGGYFDAPKRVTILGTGEEVRFECDGHRIKLSGLPEICPDPSGVAVIKMEFDQVPEYHAYSRYPQINGGQTFGK